MTSASWSLPSGLDEDRSPDLEDDLLDGLADILAVTVRANTGVGDDVAEVRRSTRLSLPAEMQWSLLPPEQFRADGFDVAAAVEPAYDTGGDVFDYAIRDDRLFLAVLDARGHGLRAAMLSTVATGAMRRARRHGADLATVGSEIAASIGALGDEHEFVSAVMVEFDIVTGEGQWLSAGHLPPLVVGNDIEALDLRPTMPLGMVVNGRGTSFETQPFWLAPDQRLVLYSDGIVENAATDDGMAIGEDRFHRALANRLIGEPADDRHPARGVIEDLLALTGPELRDDATLMIVGRGPAGTDRPPGSH